MSADVPLFWLGLGFCWLGIGIGMNAEVWFWLGIGAGIFGLALGAFMVLAAVGAAGQAKRRDDNYGKDER